MSELTPACILIASGIEDLENHNPIKVNAVSPHRTFEGDGFRIRHLAFDGGAVLSRHSAPDPIIVTVIEGAVDFVVGDESFALSGGAVLHLGPGIFHEVTAHVPSRLMVTLLG